MLEMVLMMVMIEVGVDGDGLVFSLVCFLSETGSFCGRLQAAWELEGIAIHPALASSGQGSQA